jgi:hypothetical protein
MRRGREGRRLHYGLSGGRPDHRPPEADVCGGEAATPRMSISGSFNGGRSPRRIFSVIVSEPKGRGPSDFRLLCRRLDVWPRLPTFPPPRLPSLTSPEYQFILVREGRMKFRDESESAPGTVRKSKFLSLISRAMGEAPKKMFRRRSADPRRRIIGNSVPW